MSSLSLPSPSIIPSFSLTSLPFSFLSSSSSLFSSSPDPAQSTFTSSLNFLPSSSTTPTPSSASSTSPSVLLVSSTPSSTAVSTSTVVSTSSAPSVSIASASPQPYSSFTSTVLPTSTQDSSSALVLTSTIATPSSTATQSSSGFFSNSGAVAGTFTVVGLVSIAGVIAVALFIAKRRHSRSFEEDTEFLDKLPNLSTEPPITHLTSIDDGSNSDHAHFSAPPMTLATPPIAYYPDHAYALHPQAFSSAAYPPPGPHGYSSPYPVAPTQDYAAQRIYSPEDYDIAYPPQASHIAANMPNPHQLTDAELVSAPIPPTQTALPNALRPSVRSTPSAPEQWGSTRFSVDSFYAGIATDAPPSSGRAL